MWEWGNFASNNIRERLGKGVATDLWYIVFLNYVIHH